MKKSRVREREIKVEKRYRASYIRVFVLKQRCSTFLLIRLFIFLTHFFSFLHYIIIIYIISPFLHYTISSDSYQLFIIFILLSFYFSVSICYLFSLVLWCLPLCFSLSFLKFFFSFRPSFLIVTDTLVAIYTFAQPPHTTTYPTPSPPVPSNACNLTHAYSPILTHIHNPHVRTCTRPLRTGKCFHVDIYGSGPHSDPIQAFATKNSLPVHRYYYLLTYYHLIEE